MIKFAECFYLSNSWKWRYTKMIFLTWKFFGKLKSIRLSLYFPSNPQNFILFQSNNQKILCQRLDQMAEVTFCIAIGISTFCEVTTTFVFGSLSKVDCLLNWYGEYIRKCVFHCSIVPLLIMSSSAKFYADIDHLSHLYKEDSLAIMLPITSTMLFDFCYCFLAFMLPWGTSHLVVSAAFLPVSKALLKLK